MYEAHFDAYTGTADGAPRAISDETSPVHFGGHGAIQTDLLLNLLDEIDYGLVVLGAGAQVLFANHPARLELQGERFVRRRRDRFTASVARHAAKIETALGNVMRGLRSLVSLDDAEGALPLSFIPLSPAALPAVQTSAAPLALVILGRRDACEALTLRQYGQLHGLTGAEQALLPAIIRGLSVDAIARQQCVSLSTVRTQLGSIREKTGTKSLRALAARLTSLPPIRPAFKQALAH